MGAQGTAIVDFGVKPGKTDASVAVASAGIGAGSLAEAWLWPVATSEHSADEHIMAATMVDVIACDVVAGVGFTVRIVARDLGGGSLMSAGAMRRLVASATAAQNQAGGEQSKGVGGECLNMIWGELTVAWVWN